MKKVNNIIGVSGFLFCVIAMLFASRGTHATAQSHPQHEVVVLSGTVKYQTVTNLVGVEYVPDGYTVYFISSSVGAPKISGDLAQALAFLMNQGFRMEHVTSQSTLYGVSGDPGVYTLVR